jgi:hypothetical protein
MLALEAGYAFSMEQPSLLVVQQGNGLVFVD